MGNQEETVFVNDEKAGEDQNLTGAEVQTSVGRTDQKTEEELERAYLELGKAYYEGGFEDPLPQLLPLFDRITRLRKEAERQRGICPQCGGQVEENAMFCGTCGYRLG